MLRYVSRIGLDCFVIVKVFQAAESPYINDEGLAIASYFSRTCFLVYR